MEMEEDRILDFTKKYIKQGTKLGMIDILKGRVSRSET
jgi:hypothetical protein